jgi:hypothetical protein
VASWASSTAAKNRGIEATAGITWRKDLLRKIGLLAVNLAKQPLSYVLSDQRIINNVCTDPNNHAERHR